MEEAVGESSALQMDAMRRRWWAKRRKKRRGGRHPGAQKGQGRTWKGGGTGLSGADASLTKRMLGGRGEWMLRRRERCAGGAEGAERGWGEMKCAKRTVCDFAGCEREGGRRARRSGVWGLAERWRDDGFRGRRKRKRD